MNLILHPARKTHLKEIPFKEPFLKLNYVHIQFSQPAKQAAFHIPTWTAMALGLAVDSLISNSGFALENPYTKTRTMP